MLRPRYDADFGNFTLEERDALRLKVDVFELDELIMDSLCVEGDPLLVLGLAFEVEVLFPPKMFPPLNRPPPFELAVERCIGTVLKRA